MLKLALKDIALDNAMQSLLNKKVDPKTCEIGMRPYPSWMWRNGDFTVNSFSTFRAFLHRAIGWQLLLPETYGRLQDKNKERELLEKIRRERGEVYTFSMSPIRNNKDEKVFEFTIKINGKEGVFKSPYSNTWDGTQTIFSIFMNGKELIFETTNGYAAAILTRAPKIIERFQNIRTCCEAEHDYYDNMKWEDCLLP